jgi:hypothetical protein
MNTTGGSNRLLGIGTMSCLARNLMGTVWTFTNWNIEGRSGGWILGVNFSPPIPRSEAEGVVKIVGLQIAIDSQFARR